MKYLKSQRGVAGIVEVGLALFVIGLIGFVIYRAVSTKSVPTGDSTKQTKVEEEVKTVAVSEDLFTLGLPKGWAEVAAPKQGASNECDSTGYYYSDGDNFFDVCRDPVGRDYASDMGWELVKTSTGFGITKENGQCAKEVDDPGFCSAGDNKLFIGMGAPDNLLAGHHYYFQAGNNAKEAGVDLQTYRDILASFKVK